MIHKTGLIRISLLALLLCLTTFGAVEAVNVTLIGSQFITLAPASATIEIGDPIVIEGVVSDSILGANPGNALLIVKAPKPSKFDAFTQISVKKDGSFAYSIPTDISGTWSVSVRYGDEISPVSDIIVSPRTTILKTKNLLNSYGAPASLSNDVFMTGFLRDSNGVGLGNKEITYQVAIPPYGCSFCSDDDDSDYLIWQTYGTASTDSSGKYTLSFTPHDRGQYKVKTYFGGDEAYQSSVSATRSILVN